MRRRASDADEHKSELSKPSIALSREGNHPWSSTRKMPQQYSAELKRRALMALAWVRGEVEEESGSFVFANFQSNTLPVQVAEREEAGSRRWLSVSAHITNVAPILPLGQVGEEGQAGQGRREEEGREEEGREYKAAKKKLDPGRASCRRSCVRRALWNKGVVSPEHVGTRTDRRSRPRR